MAEENAPLFALDDDDSVKDMLTAATSASVEPDKAEQNMSGYAPEGENIGVVEAPAPDLLNFAPLNRNLSASQAENHFELEETVLADAVTESSDEPESVEELMAAAAQERVRKGYYDYEALSKRLSDPATPLKSSGNALRGEEAAAAGRALLLGESESEEALASSKENGPEVEEEIFTLRGLEQLLANTGIDFSADVEEIVEEDAPVESEALFTDSFEESPAVAAWASAADEEPFVPDPEFDDELAHLLSLPTLDATPIWRQLEQEMNIDLNNPSSHHVH